MARFGRHSWRHTARLVLQGWEESCSLQARRKQGCEWRAIQHIDDFRLVGLYTDRVTQCRTGPLDTVCGSRFGIRWLHVFTCLLLMPITSIGVIAVATVPSTRCEKLLTLIMPTF